MRLKDYGRNFKLRKIYVQTSGLLMGGVDIGKSCHMACMKDLKKGHVFF